MAKATQAYGEGGGAYSVRCKMQNNRPAFNNIEEEEEENDKFQKSTLDIDQKGVRAFLNAAKLQSRHSPPLRVRKQVQARHTPM